MSLPIQVDQGSRTPASEQIRQQLREHIRSGALPDGTRLPSVRQLAGDLDLAPGTVAKSYSALEAEGFVTTSRSRGTRVATGMAVSEGIHAAALVFVAAARRAGVDLDSARAAVTRAWRSQD